LKDTVWSLVRYPIARWDVGQHLNVEDPDDQAVGSADYQHNSPDMMIEFSLEWYLSFLSSKRFLVLVVGDLKNASWRLRCAGSSAAKLRPPKLAPGSTQMHQLHPINPNINLSKSSC
jgi:hypothetical protein